MFRSSDTTPYSHPRSSESDYVQALSTLTTPGTPTLNGRKITGRPPSLAEASRFLSQSTLGADYELIKQVASIGFTEWLNREYGKPPTYHVAINNQIRSRPPDEDEETAESPYIWAWWEAALKGNDLLRQRVAFALSEIFVISQTTDTLEDINWGVATYYDLLVDGAFGNYRDLLYNNKLGFVANVGTLVEPTNLKSWTNGSARLPEGLFSHSDQIMHWQTGVPDRRSASGWGGRMADLLNNNNANQRISMNISLSGTNTFQSGSTTTSYEIEPEGHGSILLEEYDSENGAIAALGRSTVNDLMDVRYHNLFTNAFAQRNRSSIDAAKEFSSAIQSTRINTRFDRNPISSALKMSSTPAAAASFQPYPPTNISPNSPVGLASPTQISPPSSPTWTDSSTRDPARPSDS